MFSPAVGVCAVLCAMQASVLTRDASGLSAPAHALLSAASEHDAMCLLVPLMKALGQEGDGSNEGQGKAEGAGALELLDVAGSSQQVTAEGVEGANVMEETSTGEAGVGSSYEHSGVAPSLLHVACAKGWVEVVKLLLTRPAHVQLMTGGVRSRDSRGDTPLHAAVRAAARAHQAAGVSGAHACAAIAQLLVETGASTETTNRAELTPGQVLLGQVERKTSQGCASAACGQGQVGDPAIQAVTGSVVCSPDNRLSGSLQGVDDLDELLTLLKV